MIHAAPHPHAGTEIVVAEGAFQGDAVFVQDWVDREFGTTWYRCREEEAASDYHERVARDGLRPDNEVVVALNRRARPILLHASELPPAPERPTASAGRPDVRLVAEMIGGLILAATPHRADRIAIRREVARMLADRSEAGGRS